jgi:hypothetical protein
MENRSGLGLQIRNEASSYHFNMSEIEETNIYEEQLNGGRLVIKQIPVQGGVLYVSRHYVKLHDSWDGEKSYRLHDHQMIYVGNANTESGLIPIQMERRRTHETNGETSSNPSRSLEKKKGRRKI